MTTGRNAISRVGQKTKTGNLPQKYLTWSPYYNDIAVMLKITLFFNGCKVSAAYRGNPIRTTSFLIAVSSSCTDRISTQFTIRRQTGLSFPQFWRKLFLNQFKKALLSFLLFLSSFFFNIYR
jgi:hypothetical protein